MANSGAEPVLPRSRVSDPMRSGAWGHPRLAAEVLLVDAQPALPPRWCSTANATMPARDLRELDERKHALGIAAEEELPGLVVKP